MICPICKKEGSDIKFRLYEGNQIIKERCINGHVFARRTDLTDFELKKFGIKYLEIKKII